MSINTGDTPHWDIESMGEFLSEKFARHVVGLHIMFRQDGQVRHWTCTGWLGILADRALWVTAGHVIDRISELRDDPSVRVVTARWMDGGSSVSTEAIPVDLSSLVLFSATSRGFDFGAVWLRPHYQALIRANPARTFVYLNPDGAKQVSRPDGYYLVGLPQEHVKVVSGADGRVIRLEARAPAVPVKKRSADNPIANTEPGFWSGTHDIYGDILRYSDTGTCPVADIQGMSGGPLFAVRITKKLIRTQLVGVQSGWLPNSRVIRAVSLKQVYQLVGNDLSRRNAG